MIEFCQSDMARPFPFVDEGFDALMSTVALHMFDDQTTRFIKEPTASSIPRYAVGRIGG